MREDGHGQRYGLCGIRRDGCLSKVFQRRQDPRQQGKVAYPLDEILLLCLLAALAGAECFTEIALFGTKKLALLRRFRPFKDGAPAHDHLGDILATLDAEQFQGCFAAWVVAVTGVPEGVVAVDGKTSRRSGRKGATRDSIHRVSAFVAPQRLVLGQVKVAEKSNEVIAIPKLIDMLAIEGAILTIDAMGCQRDIAQMVIDKKADFVLALKGNQGSLHDDAELFVTEQKASGFVDTEISRDTTVDGDPWPHRDPNHDIHDVEWLQRRHSWPGLKGGVVVESGREISGKIERETRYYITSMSMTAVHLGHVIRSHWAIENGLHCVMDMVFRDDERRVRTNHAPANFATINFATIKHMAINLLRRPPGKQSLRGRRKAASWDDGFLASLIATSNLHPIPPGRQRRRYVKKCREHIKPPPVVSSGTAVREVRSGLPSRLRP